MIRRFDHEMIEIVSMFAGLIEANSDYWLHDGIVGCD
jgi:hypothetical protein